MGDALLPFPLTDCEASICVDMQRIFSADGPWPTPWVEKVFRSSPPWLAVIQGEPSLRRFIPPSARTRCQHVVTLLHTVAAATRERLDLDFLELSVCRLWRPFPARTVIDKRAIPASPSESCSPICESGRRTCDYLRV